MPQFAYTMSLCPTRKICGIRGIPVPRLYIDVPHASLRANGLELECSVKAFRFFLKFVNGRMPVDFFGIVCDETAIWYGDSTDAKYDEDRLDFTNAKNIYVCCKPNI